MLIYVRDIGTMTTKIPSSVYGMAYRPARVAKNSDERGPINMSPRAARGAEHEDSDSLDPIISSCVFGLRWERSDGLCSTVPEQVLNETKLPIGSDPL